MPARRYIVYPAFSGPLTLTGATLPAMIMGQAYTATVTPYTTFGARPYGPYTLLSMTGADSITLNSAGLITGTPAIPAVRITNTGAYRITNTKSVRIT